MRFKWCRGFCYLCTVHSWSLEKNTQIPAPVGEAERARQLGWQTPMPRKERVGVHCRGLSPHLSAFSLLPFRDPGPQDTNAGAQRLKAEKIIDSRSVVSASFVRNVIFKT